MLKSVRDTSTGGRKITFSLPVEQAEGPVSVVGNFNDWTPGATVLTKRGKTKSASVVVPADYIAVFRYLGENGHWFDEPEASYVDEGASVVLPPAPAARKAPARKPAAAKAAPKAPAKAASKTAALKASAKKATKAAS